MVIFFLKFFFPIFGWVENFQTKGSETFHILKSPIILCSIFFENLVSIVHITLSLPFNYFFLWGTQTNIVPT